MSTKLKQSAVKMIAIAAVIMALGLIGKVEAANPGTVDLKVTVAPALSISVGTATYSFGNLATNETAFSTGAIPVSNDSFGRTEDYRINGANSTNWTISNSTNGADTFYLRALLNTTAPTLGAFTGVFSTVDANIENMSAANHGGNQNGNNVASGSSRNLWFMLGTPTSTSFTTEQSITVTLTAADAGTF